MKVNFVLIPLAFLLLLAPSLAQSSNTSVTCINNNTASLFINITACVSGSCEATELTEVIKCPYGCDNTTGGSNDCKPDPTTSSIFNFIPSFGLLFMAAIFIYVAKQAQNNDVMAFFMFILSMTMVLANTWYVEQLARQFYFSGVSSVLVFIYQMMTWIIVGAVSLFFIQFMVNIIRNLQKAGKLRL